MNMRWIGRTTGGSSIKVPLDAPSNVAAEIDDGQVSLTWKDPPDKYAANEGGGASGDAVLVSKWVYTRVVRKQGSAPESVNDGVLICESSVRDQYATSPFVDSQVENDVLYYYGLYAFTTTGIVSEGAVISATPHAGTALSALAEGTLIKILENGAPVEFYLAKHNYESGLNGAGRELMVRKAKESNLVWDASGYPTFPESDLAQYLNGNCLNRYSATVKNLIGTTKYPIRRRDYPNILSNPPAETALFIPSLAECGYSDGKIADGSQLPTAALIFNVETLANAPIWTRTTPNEMDAIRIGVPVNGGSVSVYPESPAVKSYVMYCFTLPSTAEVDKNFNLRS